MRQSEFDAFFDPEGSKTYAVEAQRSGAGWDVEIEELRLNFFVPSEPEVFSRSIMLIADALRRPPFKVSISVNLSQ
jgi:hypothetical protein